jgi:hypothetical protein
MFLFFCVYFPNTCFDFVCKFVMLLKKTILIFELVFLVLCLMVQQEFLLYFRFMNFSLLLLHFEVLILTSLLGFFLLVAVLLLLLQIKKR